MPADSSRLTADIEKARRSLILGLLIVLAAFVVIEALRGHHFWSKVKGEGNLFNYGSSLDYFVAGEFAIVNAFLVRYYHKLLHPSRRSYAWLPWIGLGMAGVYFACDEMLTVHENLGLALEHSHPAILHFFPAGGDTVVTSSYMLLAFIFTVVYFRRMRLDRGTRRYFFAGFGLVALLTALDVIPKVIWINYMPFRETKEMIELLVGWTFASAYVTTGAFLISRILQIHHGEAISKDDMEAYAI